MGTKVKEIKKEYGQPTFAKDSSISRVISDTYARMNTLFANSKNLKTKSKIYDRLSGALPNNALKNGFEVVFKNENTTKFIENELKKLDFLKKLRELCKNSIAFGSAGLMIYYEEQAQKQGEKVEFEKEPTNIKSILSLSSFTQNEINDIVIQDDFTQPNYADVLSIKLKNKVSDLKLDKERFIILFSSRYGAEKQGTPLKNQIQDSLKVEFKVKNAIGNVAQRSAILHAKTNLPNQLNIRNSEKSKSDLEKTFNDSLSHDEIFVTDPGTELLTVSVANGFSPKDYYSAAISCIATDTGIPSSIIQGSEKGALSSSETDMTQFYELVEEYREQEIKPVIERIVNKILEINGTKEEYEIVFGDIKSSSNKEIAETEKINSETRKNNAGTIKELINSIYAAKTAGADKNIDELLKAFEDSGLNIDIIKGLIK